MDDKGTNIAEEKNAPSSGGALVVVPKNIDDFVEEEINSQILSIIGLEDVFDLTYEEYATLLKEAAVRGRMSSSQMTTESIELVTNELKRVRGKVGRFKVKRGKINIDKVMNRRSPSPQRILPQNLTPPDEEEENKKVKKFLMGDLPDRLSLVANSLDDINKTLQQQLGIEKKVSEEERKSESKSKKTQREREIEKKDKKGSDEGIKKLKGPVTGFFDVIKRYFENILAGSIIVGLVNWFQNPANKSAIDKFSNFITDNAPLILGGILALALLPVASTLLGVTGAVLGGIPKLIGALGFLATPAGLAALAVAAGVVGAATLQNVVRPAVQGLVGGESVTKSGLKFKYEDIVSLRNKAYDFMVNAGAPAEEINKQMKPYEDLMATMRYKKKLNDELADVKKNLKKREEEYKALGGDKVDTPINRTLKTEIKRLKEEEKAKEQEKQRALTTIKERFDKIGVGEAALEKAIISRGGKAERLSISTYKSPFAGARERESLKASKITGNAPITVGERAGYSASRGRVHRGRDIAAPSGTGLTVPSKSVITDKGTERAYGNYVAFKDANGVEHFYGHMIEPSPLSIGDIVSPGDIVGRVGSTGQSTGPHLHWEVSRVMNEVGRPRENVIDPIEVGFSAQTPFTGKVEAAQLAKTSPSVPTIPSPTGRSGIGGFVPVPIGGQQQITSASSASQPRISAFSPEDPNNTNIMTIKAIYNLVG
jgi:murein DD-endopeptidase MepM/ murein hydrolase activator NlpD